MRKLLSVSLVVLIAFAVSGGAISKNGLNVSRVIAMEQKSTDANMLKPLASVFPAIAPNDPYFKYQWNLDNYGKVYTSGTGKNKKTVYSNHGIQAMKAWQYVKTKGVEGGAGVKIAILYSGVAYENYTATNGVKYYKAPEFTGITFENPKDFTALDTSADYTHANDWYGPGTAFCSMIAGKTNNSIGTAGIAYNATIIPIKIFGEVTSWKLSAGINHAVASGADVIVFSNNQWAEEIPAITLAIENAYAAGVIIICAPHNDNNGVYIYPAAYDEVITVGSTRFDGARSASDNSYSGPYLDIVAPGGDMSVDQNLDGKYDGIQMYAMSSTDFSNFYISNQQWMGASAAQVAAVAALILSIHTDWTKDSTRVGKVYSALTTKAKDLGTTGFDNTFGYGLLDAYGAVSYTP